MTATGTPDCRVITVANVGEQLQGYDAKVFEVTVQLEEVDSILRPAMTTSNEILTYTFQNVLYLPLEAIQSDSISFVYKKAEGKIVKQEVITRDTLETLPVAKSLQSFVAIIPGLQVAASGRDVGGTTGDRPLGVQIHGSRTTDQHIFYNGMRTNNVNASPVSTGGGRMVSGMYTLFSDMKVCVNVWL